MEQFEYTWDDNKNNLNHNKHSVWFEEATQIFVDSHKLIFFDELHSSYEDRFIAIGVSFSTRVLIVSFKFTEPGIRIISARRATKKERIYYEKGIYIIKT